ncbi:division/cell wall cluster transcriptional repressor MraZ [Tranquillimonas alkanivorans]|uniref:Transcriptional regulator MraZ n=1 Tax=Tranquillimonas alkanivorans TaxID=441119 RepID=A0A1I5LZC1_9RHOB|nr:division/cell wall cluster transcriptional repressor MraZ [Tranquillimonas alkanivorans]SFP02560.1 MraZ protein [Tranquillimonas alkanivorans]
MVRTFRGESVHKVDTKGRVSIPAGFRRVLESGDPSWVEGRNPELVIVYGDQRRHYLECFTVKAIQSVDKKIRKMPRASKKRRALQRLYNGQAVPTSVDETGRLVLPIKLREKIGLDGEAFFIGNGDTFEIWKPETYDEEAYAGLDEDDDFDPDADPSVYLEGGDLEDDGEEE